jgi:hypothetical protein
MRHQRFLALLCTAWQLVGCARAEPSYVPLGHGVLAQAESENESALPPKEQQRPLPSADPSGGTANGDESRPASGGQPATHGDPPGKADAGAPETPSQNAKGSPTSPNGPSLDDWPGLYRGSDTTVFKTDDQPDRSFDDPKARIRVERGSHARVVFTLVDSSNDKDICELSATVEAGTATIEAGQPCFIDPDETMTVKSRPGKATLKDRRLTFDLVLDTILDTESGTASGTIDYHFEGRR